MPRGLRTPVGRGRRARPPQAPRGASRCRGRSPRRAGSASSWALISAASPGRSFAAAISAASCSAMSRRRASSRGSSSSSASAARFARQRSTAPAIVSRSSPCPPNASRRSRCQRASSKPLLLVLAMDLHERSSNVGQARRRDRLVVQSGRRSSGRRDLAGGDQRLRDPVEQGLTRAASAPWRMSVESARAPVARPSASISRLFPAPVSPVKTFSPGARSSRSRSIRARSVTVSSRRRPAGCSPVTTAAARPSAGTGPRTAARRPARRGGSAARARGPPRRRRRRSGRPRGRRC